MRVSGIREWEAARPRHFGVKEMSTMLQMMHELACAVGEDEMRQKNALSQSFFHILLDGDKIAVIPTPWNNPFEKEIYISAMRMLIREKAIVAYSFVTEAWLATVAPHQAELAKIPPSQRSNRKDILMIMSRHRDGEYYMTQYEVEYDADGKVTLSEPDHNSQEVEGLMGNLFEAD